MTVKTTGAEFKRFSNDKEFWPYDSYIVTKGSLIKINGKNGGVDADQMHQIPDDAEVEIVGGDVAHIDSNSCTSLADFFLIWKKAQTTISIVVEVDVSKLDAVIAAIEAAGGKVI